METDDLEYILSKQYHELTSAEKAHIQDICQSEEEFLQMKQFFTAVEDYVEETTNFDMPRASTKASLDELFHQTYQNKGILWYNSIWITLYAPTKKLHQKPLVRIAALLILSLSVLPFVGKQSIDQPQIAKLTSKNKLQDTDSAKGVVEKKVEPLKRNDAQEIPSVALSNSNLQLAQLDEMKLEEAEFEKNMPAEAQVETIISNLSVAGNRLVNPLSKAESVDFVATMSRTNHPDGIYMENQSEKDSKIEDSRSLAVLDLLTPTF